MDRVYNPSLLTKKQAEILKHLQNTNLPTTTREIARATGINMTTLAIYLRILEQKGLLTCTVKNLAVPRKGAGQVTVPTLMVTWVSKEEKEGDKE